MVAVAVGLVACSFAHLSSSAAKNWQPIVRLVSAVGEAKPAAFAAAAALVKTVVDAFADACDADAFEILNYFD